MWMEGVRVENCCMLFGQVTYWLLGGRRWTSSPKKLLYFGLAALMRRAIILSNSFGREARAQFFYGNRDDFHEVFEVAVCEDFDGAVAVAGWDANGCRRPATSCSHTLP